MCKNLTLVKASCVTTGTFQIHCDEEALGILGIYAYSGINRDKHKNYVKKIKLYNLEEFM